MPLPLLAPAAPALLAAAEWTLATCAAGLVAIGVMESTKDKEGEQDKAKADTQTITSSRTECEKCPAIGKVMMVWEKTTSYSEITIAYQTKIAGTIYNPELNLIETWLCMDTNFDGWKPAQCLFLEAKAKYDQFFKNGEPKRVSRPRELPPQPLAERYVSLSTHTAPIKQTRLSFLLANGQTTPYAPLQSFEEVLRLGFCVCSMP
ncbi:restriction endonuclease fold toxin 5 domain-containing protein [Photorhabdus heterorhabditis]|uniref:restriction endonuclease fold toxin 5 domain-containing protein n=1 Tax=Photorhabdus heterorhabditis TaxID=880156 RepID=UPI0021D32CDB|nr:restriction endonuclease fold toxin 5 domain-containing protein [Photorhabdus heterorhabditis]